MATAVTAARWLWVLLLSLSLLVAVEVEAAGSTVVAGMVFCDQCKDGSRGLLDYPLYGGRVVIECGGGDTPVTVRECSTNWFGGFSLRMDGSPDMNRCTARLVQASGHCGAAAASAAPRDLTLAFRMLGLSLYTVQPLLSQPAEAMDFCPAAPAPAAAAAAAPVPVSSPPPPPPFWLRRPRPVWRRPPAPAPAPPQPAADQASASASACTYEVWASPQRQCHWKVVTPNTTVAMAFGPAAAQRYGAEMTLREALEGRGDMYRTLLREAAAALLNAYYNTPGGPFLYPTTASVIDHLNGALAASSTAHRVLLEGARFRRANSGAAAASATTKLSCSLAPCAANATP